GRDGHADRRVREELPTRDHEAPAARRQQGGEDQPRRQEARSRGEQRWQRVDGDLDREVRRSPDEVDDPEGDPHASRGRAHMEEDVSEATPVRTNWPAVPLLRDHSGPRWSRTLELIPAAGEPERRVDEPD